MHVPGATSFLPPLEYPTVSATMHQGLRTKSPNGWQHDSDNPKGGTGHGWKRVLRDVVKILCHRWLGNIPGAQETRLATAFHPISGRTEHSGEFCQLHRPALLRQKIWYHGYDQTP